MRCACGCSRGGTGSSGRIEGRNDSVQARKMSYDSAIHSDFLIHWTGKDIDSRLAATWATQDKSKTDTQVSGLYYQRLLDTLDYGLWMTIEPGEKYGSISLPDTAKCCFTELKLSQSRAHAKQYGRLGIGFKRPFLFERLGKPVSYFGYYKDRSDDRLLQSCDKQLTDRRLMHYFKPMNSSETLNYDLYGESEWRILPFEELIDSKKIINPRDSRNEKHHAFFKSLSPKAQEKLGYFIPLDGWFAMLIFPSLEAKNDAQRSPEIRNRISEIKDDLSDHGNRVEDRNWPIEISLDACRNF
jgi:hypothetical protein